MFAELLACFGRGERAQLTGSTQEAGPGCLLEQGSLRALGPVITEDAFAVPSPFRSLIAPYPEFLGSEAATCTTAKGAHPVFVRPTSNSNSPQELKASNPLANDHLEGHLLPAGLELSSLQLLLDANATTTSHHSATSTEASPGPGPGLGRSVGRSPNTDQPPCKTAPAGSAAVAASTAAPATAPGNVGDTPDLRGLTCEQLVRLCCPEELTGDLAGIKVIGQGSGSVVCQALWRGARVAVKFTASASLHPSSSAIIRQALVSKALAHPNVLQHFSVRCCRLATPAAPPTPPASASQTPSVPLALPQPEPPRGGSYPSGEAFQAAGTQAAPNAPECGRDSTTTTTCTTAPATGAATAASDDDASALVGMGVPRDGAAVLGSMASASAPASTAVNAGAAPDASLMHLSAEAASGCGGAVPVDQNLVRDLDPVPDKGNAAAAKPPSVRRLSLHAVGQALLVGQGRAGAEPGLGSGLCGGNDAASGAKTAGADAGACASDPQSPGAADQTRRTSPLAMPVKRAVLCDGAIADNAECAIATAQDGSSGLTAPSAPATATAALVAACAAARPSASGGAAAATVGFGPAAPDRTTTGVSSPASLSFNSYEGFGNPLGGLKHALSLPHVVALVSARDGEYLTAIIMEHADKSTLQSALQRGLFVPGRVWDERIALRAALRTALEVACALQHLHSRDVVHGAVRPGNVLLKSSVLDRRGFTAKVTNFSLARVCSGDSDNSSGALPVPLCAVPGAAAPGDSQPAGSTGDGSDNGSSGDSGPWDKATPALLSELPYWSPEELRGVAGKPADVYAYGVILYTLFSGSTPYGGMPAPSIADGIMDGTLRPQWPHHAGGPRQVRELCGRCWEADPRVRPTFEQICSSLKAVEQAVRRQQRAVAAPASVESVQDSDPTGCAAAKGGAPAVAGHVAPRARVAKLA